MQSEAPDRTSLNSSSSEIHHTYLKMVMPGSRPDVELQGEGELPGKSNYLMGNDPSRWQTNVPTYSRVRYRDLYPGIDLTYYGKQGEIEYDFIVRPGADPEAIRLKFPNAQTVSLDQEGNLLITATDGRDVLSRAPVVYQQLGSLRKTITGRYVTKDNGEIGFAVDHYDRRRPLVIDPVVVVYTKTINYISYNVVRVALDPQGNVYLTG